MFRGYKYRKVINFMNLNKHDAAVKIQKVYRGWYHRLKSKRELKLFAIDQGI